MQGQGQGQAAVVRCGHWRGTDQVLFAEQQQAEQRQYSQAPVQASPKQDSQPLSRAAFTRLRHTVAGSVQQAARTR